MKRICLGVALTLMLWFTPAAEGFVSWTNASGSTTYFDWENGGSANGLYGSPIIMGDTTFVFFPSQFRAEASDGATISVSDTLSFDILLKDPYCLAGIRVSEYGDYGVLGVGSSVSATGQLDLLSLINGGTMSTDLVMTPGFPVTTGNGSWSGQGEVTGLFCDAVRISLTNELIAISSAGSTTYIQKKGSASALAITIIPEPMTLVLLGLGSVVLLRKQK